ncbi:DUF861 domain-containing protein [Nonomuraea sp. MG754425]|uniref:cupin domain-containing protein n=1 Tax=Nonomuraea sp. MG754425 TaxID=2570319 RepID=UPI001F40665A|nr:cupin domain-containing protein [Nonomuraea sp. MG754425]MCF6467844.1 DUF861 domain-containing protein [Nonomuraea sp. MG754425]
MSIFLPDALTADLGSSGPKPTSIAGDQVEAVLKVWTAHDDAAATGVWECTPGTFTAVRDGHHEICQILVGRATVVEEGGTPIEIGPGSTLVLPDGWRGEWRVHETIRKVYVTVRT